jgi:hypothetical protein
VIAWVDFIISPQEKMAAERGLLGVRSLPRVRKKGKKNRVKIQRFGFVSGQ